MRNGKSHALHLITGRAGSKKSTELYAAMQAVAQKGERSLLIVPEQYALTAERELIAALGGVGLLDAEVLPFSRLEYRVLLETGGLAYQREDAVLLSMRLRGILKGMQTSLRYYGQAAQTAGFVPEMMDMLQECARYGLTAEKLRSCAKQAIAPQLAAKLSDIADIMAALGSGCMPAHQTDWVTERIPDSFLKYTHVFIDGFEMWTDQVQQMLEQIMCTAPSLTVTLFLPNARHADIDIFRRERYMRAALFRMAHRHGIQVTHTRCPGGAERACGPIKHVERNLYAYPYETYTQKQDRVRLYLADTAGQEIAFAAQELIKLARDKGLAWRDMAVVTGDLEGAENTVREVFTRAGIPFYIDARRSLNTHPLLKLVTHTLMCVAYDFNLADVIELIKTGLTPLTQDQSDAFENYMLSANCGGFRLRSPLQAEDMEPLRALLMEPLLTLEEALRAARTGAEAVAALFALLQAYPAERRLGEMAEAFGPEQAEVELSVHAQAQEQIYNVLTRIARLGGNMDIMALADLVQVGCASGTIGVLPPEGDRVMVGAAMRSMPPRVKALLVLSLCDGLVPPAAPAGMLTEGEVLALRGLRTVLGRTRAERAYDGSLAIYRLMARTTDYLYVCARQDDMAPGMLYYRLRDLFPGSPIRRCGGMSSEGRALSLQSLSGIMRALSDGVQPPQNAAMLYRAHSRQWPGDIKRLKSALNYSPALPALDRDAAGALLMPKGMVSVTRLSRFIACPYFHFVQDGLRAKPRELYEETRADEGNFMHKVLERFMRAFKEGELNREPCDYEKNCALLDAVFEQTAQEHKQGILQQSGEWAYRKRVLHKVLTRRAHEMCEHLSQSDAVPIMIEADFAPWGNLPPLALQTPEGDVLLRGKIDRVDSLVHENTRYFCVIDYKSGNSAELTMKLLQEGKSLQLPIYMSAILSVSNTNIPQKKGFQRDDIPLAGPGAEPRRPSALIAEPRRSSPLAMLYQPLMEPNPADGVPPPAALAMRGAVLSDEKLLKKLDYTLEPRMRARFIPAALTKDGNVNGNIAGPLSSEALDEMMEESLSQAARAAADMLRGSVSPERGGACSYCIAKSQCFLSLSADEDQSEEQAEEEAEA